MRGQQTAFPCSERTMFVSESGAITQRENHCPGKRLQSSFWDMANGDESERKQLTQIALCIDIASSELRCKVIIFAPND